LQKVNGRSFKLKRECSSRSSQHSRWWQPAWRASRRCFESASCPWCKWLIWRDTYEHERIFLRQWWL